MSNNKKHIPARLPDGTNNPEYIKQWKEDRMNEDPIRVREMNRICSMMWRKENPERYASYYNAYMREYYKKNKHLHYIRTIPSCIKTSLLKGHKFRDKFQTIYENLLSVGWTPNTKQQINHLISLKLMIKTNPNLCPTIAFDPLVIEMIDKIENCSAGKREVNNNTLILASKMEKKYPKELKGLTKNVKQNLGKII